MNDSVNSSEMYSVESDNNVKGTIVVIMPFNKIVVGSKMNFDTIYELFIERTIKELKYFPFRVDRIESTDEAFISKRIFKPLTNRDNFVLADLTDNNPNVYYELGIRHALVRTGAILIIQEGKEIPFDLKDQEVIKYSPDLYERGKFKDTIDKCLHKKKGGLSPIPGWLDNYDDILDQTSDLRKELDSTLLKLSDKENELESRKKLDDIIIETHQILLKLKQRIDEINF